MAQAAHLQPARGDTPGPETGGYFTLMFTTGACPGDGAIGTETHSFKMAVPCDCRIMEISARASTATDAPTYTVIHPSGDVIADRPILVAGEVITPTSSPALANRTFTKGQVLQVDFIAAGGTDLILGGCVAVTMYAMDHVVASSAND